MDIPGIANLAFQCIGTRTTVTQAELNAQSSNEAIQFNLTYAQTRDELLRMAPWDCCTGFADLTYITSLPGTPENQAQPANQNQWSPGLPLPPWAYEYTYPVDCLRALRIVPQFNTGINGTPIYPNGVSTGYSSLGQGPPVRFDVGNDNFWSATGVTIVSLGSGYVLGELITLLVGPFTSMPIGAPAVIQVNGVNGSGGITSASIVNSIIGSSTPAGGAYFTPPTNPQPQASSNANGTGATFNLTYTYGNQRVILTNQEFAVLAYCRQITNPNVMDSLFQKALYNIIGGTLCMALTGDKQLANSRIQIANGIIAEARAVDGNEGLTINDVTPDFLRVRGIAYDCWVGGTGVEWGSYWNMY